MSKQSKHIKRIAMPRSWPLPRKGTKYLTKPLPGKKLQYAIPVCIVLRDMLKLTITKKEIKKILHTKEVLVDNNVIGNDSFPVGLFDVLSLPKIKQYYRMEISRKGKLCMKKIEEKDAYVKPCKIIGKKTLPKGKIQINLYDGKNFLHDKGKVNDSVVVDLKQNKIIKQIPLEKGASVCITGGKNIGMRGTVENIEDKFVIIKSDSGQVKTTISNVFVMG